jgi:glutaredoxin-related protein
MEYSNTTALSGIIQEEERLTGLGYANISGNTQNLKEFTSLNNIVSHRIWHTIFTSNGNWQYDDSNKTDLPSGATSLISGTSKYATPSDALTVKRIELKDAAGEWFRAIPITLEEIQTKGDFMTDSGNPRYYTLVNATVELFPTPNYASTNGLKVFYDRDCVEFATTDTTKTPGFASPYHSIIPVAVAIEWLKTKLNSTFAQTQLNYLMADYVKLEKNLKEFYSLRFKDKKPRVGRVYSSFK